MPLQFFCDRWTRGTRATIASGRRRRWRRSRNYTLRYFSGTVSQCHQCCDRRQWRQRLWRFLSSRAAQVGKAVTQPRRVLEWRSVLILLLSQLTRSVEMAGAWGMEILANVAAGAGGTATAHAFGNSGSGTVQVSVSATGGSVAMIFLSGQVAAAESSDLQTLWAVRHPVHLFYRSDCDRRRWRGCQHPEKAMAERVVMPLQY